MIAQQDLVVYQRIFKQNLLQISGAPAVDYLKQRKIKWETVLKFQLGYAYNTRDIKELPWFNQCITIPCFSVSGEIVGMFGRCIEIRESKYTISKGYDKDLAIFGLNQAQEAILEKGFVILTEGIFDCITMSQSGFTNTISAPGKSWSDIQLIKLMRYTQNVLLIFDNDTVGRDATEKISKQLKDLGFYTANLNVPAEYKDVDEFIRADLEEAIPYLNKQIEVLKNV